MCSIAQQASSRRLVGRVERFIDLFVSDRRGRDDGRELADDGAQMFLLDFGVDLRGRQVLVAEEIRDVSEVHTCHAQMSAEAVPQCMYCDGGETGLPAELLEFRKNVCVEIALLIWECKTIIAALCILLAEDVAKRRGDGDQPFIRLRLPTPFGLFLNE